MDDVLEHMVKTTEISVKLLDNQIEHLKNMEENYRLQRKMAEATKKVQTKLFGGLNKAMKDMKETLNEEVGGSCDYVG